MDLGLRPRQNRPRLHHSLVLGRLLRISLLLLLLLLLLLRMGLRLCVPLIPTLPP